MMVALWCVCPGVASAQDGADADSDGDPPQARDEEPTSGDPDDDDPASGEPSENEPAEDDEDASDAPPDFPDEPRARLQRAEQAYGNAKYDLLRPLLEPTLVPDARFDELDREIEARQLLGVGLFVEAQQTTNAQERRDLLDRTKRQFLAILREKPDYELDPLNYPASVVELFEQVREENSEELDRIRAEQTGEDGATTTQTFYVERVATRRIFAVNFAPFGLGQFQNGNEVAGRIFAVGQGAMLALNAVGYLGVQLADEDNDNLYRAEGPGGELAIARTWQTVQWSALAGFGALYLWSVIDGIARYQSEDVRIRSLDKPPPELSVRPDEKHGPRVHIGVGSVLLRW
jgi:hypothetical protein